MNGPRAHAVKYLHDEAIPCVVSAVSGMFDAEPPRDQESDADRIGLVVVEVDCAGGCK